MLRSIAAVVVTYIVMAILIIAAFTGLWLGLGPDRLLRPGSFQGNMFLCIAAPSITVLVGIFGGWMCAKMAGRGRGRTPVLALAGVALALGLITAFFTLQKPFPADPRSAGMTMQQMMEVGREPTWLLIFNPIGGAGEVVVGGLLLGNGRKAGPGRKMGV